MAVQLAKKPIIEDIDMVEKAKWLHDFKNHAG